MAVSSMSKPLWRSLEIVICSSHSFRGDHRLFFSWLKSYVRLCQSAFSQITTYSFHLILISTRPSWRLMSYAYSIHLIASRTSLRPLHIETKHWPRHDVF